MSRSLQAKSSFQRTNQFPYPPGHGIMVVPYQDDKNTTISANNISQIGQDHWGSLEIYIIGVHERSTANFSSYKLSNDKKIVEKVINHMYRRALLGDDADYRDYDENGDLRADYQSMDHRIVIEPPMAKPKTKAAKPASARQAKA